MSICQKKIKIYLLGVHHYDLFGREKIVSELSKIKLLEEHDPMFIATEWPINIYQKYIKYKGDFVKKIKENWPFLDYEVIKGIASTYMYEIDVAYELFNGKKTIELRDESEEPFKSVREFILERTKKFETWINGEKNFTRETLNKKIFENMMKEGEDLTTINQKFSSIIIKWIETFRNSLVDYYAIVIVGLDHIKKPPGNSIKDILTDSALGYNVESKILFPDIR